MNIEIVEFYIKEKKGNNFKGTLHVYLIDLQTDLRGVNVCRKNNRWWFNLPSFIGIDEDTKEKIRYPIISFTDAEKHKSLMKEIIEKGKEYIINSLKQKNNS